MKQPSTSWSRRSFLKAGSAALGSLSLLSPLGPSQAGAAGQPSARDVAGLPKGAAPAPLAFPHFPSRLHAFVWRNWPLVPVARMAQVVAAKRVDLERMGRAMGLGPPPRISSEQQARSYLTVIRRNWHLLPYEQLLTLLDWSPEQLAFTLREDDFLWIKLGSLKPECAPLRYEPPDAATQKREQEIAQIVRAEFPEGLHQPGEPLFHFVSRLSARPEKSAFPVQDTAPDGLRFCYSYFALYGDPLLEPHADPYPDGLLARLAQAGVNGVWLQAVLHKLAPFPWAPDRSARHQDRLQQLRKLVARARQHGIRIFLYLNEPRAMPLSFFAHHPHLQGVQDGGHATLCTSVPEVQDFLVNAIATICRTVPALGGFFSITASENLTNCWSHGGGAKCPRCARRPAADVIAEVNRLFQQGIVQGRKTSPTARRSVADVQSEGPMLIAWDWGWDDRWAGEVIRQLPPEVALQSVSEWRLPIERGGVKTEVGEYSISAIGPGPRARRHWRLARERGLKAIAKIQAGNTWELSAVPYIPAVANVARHAENLRRENVHGLMLGWTLGGYPSPNLEVVAEVLAGGPAEAALQRVAARRFGQVLAPAVTAAWRDFSTAFQEFPYHIGVVYSGPQQLGPANLLWSAPTGYQATMVGFPYDDLERWRSVYPPEIFAAQFEKVADGFDRALAALQRAAPPASSIPGAARAALQAECRVAEAAAIHFRSVAQQTRFILARRAAAASNGEAGTTAAARAAMKQWLQAEISLARRLHALQSADARIGFEASNQYYYVPIDLVEKVLNCRHLLAGLSPG
ncbi:MAG TPA: twin-arginine translocation signal domain-containing protein [Verrucomicrobiota bacterium]|nr:twin-arginine translocation signal domain-containing protein [Verrucomicrobiota bacterium]HNT15793.1 twin-arginine translocation signal domain-containing protein [Verrucomicrobiota bacterium]